MTNTIQWTAFYRLCHTCTNRTCERMYKNMQYCNAKEIYINQGSLLETICPMYDMMKNEDKPYCSVCNELAEWVEIVPSLTINNSNEIHLRCAKHHTNNIHCKNITNCEDIRVIIISMKRLLKALKHCKQKEEIEKLTKGLSDTEVATFKEINDNGELVVEFLPEPMKGALSKLLANELVEIRKVHKMITPFSSKKFKTVKVATNV